MKKISLLFRGKFNIYSMSVTVRLWNTSVCIADESCSLRCKKLSILCERRDECIKAPISACLKCRGQYLRTIYDESVNLTNDAIFKFLCKSRDMRETFESLKNDFFFKDYEDQLVRFRPLSHKIRQWMKSVELYGIVGVGWTFFQPQPCRILYKLSDNGFLIELERRHYDREKNILGDKIDFVKKNNLGTPDDFNIHVSFANVDLEYSTKISALVDDFRFFFQSFTKDEVSFLYDMDANKLQKAAKEASSSLSYSGLLNEFLT